MATYPANITDGQAVLVYNAGQYEESSSYVIGGSTTAPTPGSGATFYRNTYRDGRYAVVRFEFSQLNAGSAGSGDYLFPLPSALAIDYTKENVVSVGSGATGAVGYGMLLSGSVNYVAVPYSVNSGVYTNKIAINIGSDTVPLTGFGSPTGPLSNAVVRLSITVRIPIVGWDLTEYVAVGAGVSTTLPSLTSGGIESGTHATNWSGPFASTAGNIPYVRNGKQVTLMLPRMRVTGNNTASAISSLTALPVSLRPVAGIQGFILVTDANTDQNTPGSYSINTAGGIQISKTVSAGNFTATASTVGFYEMSVTYTTA